MRRGFKQKAVSMLLATSLVVGSTTVMTGCNNSKKASNDGPVTLTVYSQVANYSGLQTGWMGDLLLKKFNVKLNIVPESDGIFQTKMENGDLGDIVIWGGKMDQYSQAVKAGLLYDLEEDDLINEEGKDIVNTMSDALQQNRNITSKVTDGEDDTLYGWGSELATSNEDHKSFFYTWDTRWDLYKKLGYPKVKNLDEYASMLKKMQELDPKDDAGNKTYAVSLWPDWDDAMVMYAKSTATAYYGYDELGIGLYDPATGTYHDALEQNGPYLQMLKWYNNLYREGLLDPDSMTQTYDQMLEKVQNGGVLFSIFNYSGQLAFNSSKHLKAGEYMYCMKPEEASPIVYGLSTLGANYITSIGANTEYPELCMQILDYFCTPEGFMTMTYGPQGECWDYDKDGNTYLTDLGEECHKSSKTKMTEHDGTFQDGQMQMAVSTWSVDSPNPDSNGETFNCDYWKSRTDETNTKIQKDWKKFTGCEDSNSYFEQGKYTLSPGSTYTMSTKSDDLKTVWKQVTDCIKTESWNAIYAKSDKEFDSVVAKMVKDTAGYGYDQCLKWSQQEAKTRKAAEDEAAKITASK